MKSLTQNFDIQFTAPKVEQQTLALQTDDAPTVVHSGSLSLNNFGVGHTIFGGVGDDSLVGGYITDRIYGHQGNDQLYGGLGEDSLFGQEGADSIYGGDGNDRIFGGSEDDTIWGENNNDIAYGDEGNDKIYGGYGNDSLFGDEGSDTLVGGTGDDTLLGMAGADYLYGGSGDDYIIGGQDAGSTAVVTDIAYGGAGDDIYAFTLGSADDTFHGGDDFDQIYMAISNPGPIANWLHLDQGSFSQAADGTVFLSNDAAGTITLSDGSTLAFDGVEHIYWG